MAAQPPFIEVAIGIGFVLLLAPGVLAAVALLLTKLEAIVEGAVAARLSGRRPATSTQSGANSATPRTTQRANAMWAFLDMNLLQR